MEKKEAKKRIGKLKELINHHRHQYHVLDKQDIREDVLDSLKHELYNLEQLFPELITPDSPTQRIGSKPLEKFKKKEHKFPMLSLEDVFSKKELEDWRNYLKRLAPNDFFEYFCELKIDGLAVSLIYKKGFFKAGLTRGDGKTGEDVSQNLKTIESIPLKLGFGKSERSSIFKKAFLMDEFEVRGEVYMDKKDFLKINRKLENSYSNPRNLAAGSIRQLDPKLAASRPLKFAAYSIVTDIGQKTHSEEHHILNLLGFKTDKGKICKSLDQIVEYWQKAVKKRDSLSFQIDGVVVSVNDNRLFKKLGVAGKSPRASRAFKFSPKKATTKIIDIQVQVGRTGAVTPIAILEPVEIDGVLISRATLHNQEEINRLGVMIKDTVIIERAGDVIPSVSKVLPELRTGQEEKFDFPKKCPHCLTKLIKPKGEAVWRCLNENCSARIKENLYHFVSKKAFNIDGLGPKIIDKLIEEKLISSPVDIFYLKEEDLVFLENFGEKSSRNLIEAIQKSKKISFARFIFSLGIRHLGEETAFDLANYYFNDIFQLKKVSEEELINIPEIGPKTAKSIYNWFQSKKNLEFLDKLINSGITIFNESKKIKKDKLKGKTFVFTGSLDSITRDHAYQKIRFQGGKTSENISSKTDYLISGKKPGSKLDKAKKLGVRIIDEKEFLKLIEQ